MSKSGICTEIPDAKLLAGRRFGKYWFTLFRMVVLRLYCSKEAQLGKIVRSPVALGLSSLRDVAIKCAACDSMQCHAASRVAMHLRNLRNARMIDLDRTRRKPGQHRELLLQHVRARSPDEAASA